MKYKGKNKTICWDINGYDNEESECTVLKTESSVDCAWLGRLEYEWELRLLHCPTLSTTRPLTGILYPFQCTRQVSNFQCYKLNRKQLKLKVGILTWAVHINVKLASFEIY